MQPGPHWVYIRKWCLVAGEANANGKSKVFLGTTPVTVDDEDFDRWVGTRLDIAFGPRPSTYAGPAAGMTGNQPAMDFLALSKMLSTTIGTNMMQFSQAVTPTGGAAGSTGDEWGSGEMKGPACLLSEVPEIDQPTIHMLCLRASNRVILFRNVQRFFSADFSAVSAVTSLCAVFLRRVA